MILEGIINTTNADGSVNISPMGPVVDTEMRRMALRPFPSSTTCVNLRREGHAVFHVVDNVELLARAAIDRFDAPPPLLSMDEVPVPVLADACRWYAIEVREIDDSEPRVLFECEVVARGRLRDFFGFNRAKHAVIEGAILATRLHILPVQEIREEFERLAVLVQKTAGPQEQKAFDLLRHYIEEQAAHVEAVETP